MIVLTVVLLGLLAFPVNKAITQATGAHKVAETEALLITCRSASLCFYTNVNRWPANLPELVTHSNGPFIITGKPGFLDSWGRYLIYVAPIGTNVPGSIKSLGEDGLPGGTNVAADIIVTIP